MTTDSTAFEQEDITKTYERLAREQMGLDQNWSLVSVSSAVTVGLEDQVDHLDSNDDLTDSERWQELQADNLPLAWLPKGLILMEMKNMSDSSAKVKAGFVNTSNA